MRKRHLFLYGVFFFLFNTASYSNEVADSLVNIYGSGETTLKKRVKISFFLDDDEQVVKAKASYYIKKLYIRNGFNGYHLEQLPFNQYQSVDIDRARFFKLNEEGRKVLVENVKTRYLDEKDYYINNIFFSDLKIKQFQNSVELPDVYFLDYGYEETYHDLKFLNSFYFQHRNEKVIEAEIEIEKNALVDFDVFEFNLPDHIDNSSNDEEITYKVVNLNRYKSYSNKSLGQSYYLPHLIITVKSVNQKKSKKDIISSKASLYNWYSSLIKELVPQTPPLQNLLSSIITNDMSDEEKIESIFNWTKTYIQYVAFEDGIAGFKPEEAHNVLLSKYGDCKGIANLLVNLLSLAGYDAEHAWIGTRNRPYSYETPSLVVDNHMICALDFKGSRYFLDGTSKSATWNTPPYHLLGKEVLVAQGNEFNIDTIPIPNSSLNTMKINGDVNVNESSAVSTFKATCTLTGYFNSRYFSFLNYAPKHKKDLIPYYIIEDYINELSIESVTLLSSTQDSTVFTIEGKYLQGSKSKNHQRIYPFFDLMAYSYKEAEITPDEIDFPHVLEVNLHVKHNDAYILKDGFSKKFGNEEYNCQYAVNAVQEGLLIVNQRLSFDVLHNHQIEDKEWNNFYYQTKAYANQAITLEGK